MTIDEIFPDPVPNFTEEDRDSKVVADREDEEQQSQDDMQDQIAADSEDEIQQHDKNCPDLMETLEEVEFVYEELEQHVESQRAQHEARMAETPALRKPPRCPFNATFYSSATNQRYQHLISRTVMNQRFLPFDAPKLEDARKIIEKYQLMYTVLDVPGYTLDVVYEFYANLGNMIKRDDTTCVYVRKHMYELINSIFKTPCQEADFPQMPWETESLDDAVKTITNGKNNKWGNLSMLDVTPTMNIMFKFCVFSWMSTANRSTLTIDHLKFFHMITEGRSLDFGVMVFDQLYEIGHKAISGKSNKLLFPNLIQHILDTQHPIPVRGGDADHVAPII